MAKRKSNVKVLKVKDALAAAAPAPTTEAMVVEFMRYAGGPSEFAKLLYTEFVSAAPGSITRQRILEAVMRGMNKIDTDKKVLSNLGHLSEEDLDRLIEEKLTAIADKRAADESEADDGEETGHELDRRPGHPAEAAEAPAQGAEPGGGPTHDPAG